MNLDPDLPVDTFDEGEDLFIKPRQLTKSLFVNPLPDQPVY
jgi:hypothetical protein